MVLPKPLMPPLASAYLKLIRAQEHLDPLVDEIRRWENSHPYRLIRETDEDAAEYVAYGLLDTVPGDEWYGRFGDLIHNLHGVLDHAILGLSEFFAGRRLTDGEARSVEFPVYTDPGKWEGFVAAGMPAIRFLPPAYREVVESNQPYRGPNDYIRTSHPMHVLHALWNLDKHRQITFFAGSGKVVMVYVPGNPSAPYRVTAPVVDNGSEVARIPISSVKSKEDFEPIIQVEVALQEGGPPRNPMSGAVQPIGSFAGYMHASVFDVLQTFDDMLRRGVR